MRLGESEPAAVRRRSTRAGQSIGLMSLGLGSATLFAPRAISAFIGAEDSAHNLRVLRLIGLRDIVLGTALLSKPRDPHLLWARVASDVLDLTLLANAARKPSPGRGRLAWMAAAAAAAVGIDTMSAVRFGGARTTGRDHPALRVSKSITIQRSRHDVYHFWRDLRNLPRFMAHLESVQVENGVSYWRAKAPAKTTVAWKAQVVIDRPGEAIGWRSLPGSEIRNMGMVHFLAAPGGKGTEVRVDLQYEPPAGRVGAAIAKLFGENPEQQVDGDLRRLKQVLETGEVVHSDASIHRFAHPARPSADARGSVRP